MFDCKIKDGFIPKLPINPDKNQIGVKWIKLTQLNDIVLHPNIRKLIINYAKTRKNIEFIEEYRLEEYVLNNLLD